MREAIENFILKQNAKAVRHIRPANFQSGGVLEVNAQIKRDFGLVGPMALSEPSLRVHQLRWAMVRELFVVETHVSRFEKELIASGVSSSNICPYCVDVHETSMQSLNQQPDEGVLKQLQAWSLNTKHRDAEIIKHPPFSKAQAPEMIGTALEFHSTNRLVSIFLEESPLPSMVSRLGMKKVMLSVASKTFFKTMVMKKPKAGDAKQFLEEQVPDADYAWAESVPLYGLIRRNHLAILLDIEKAWVPESVAHLFKQCIADWHGEDMPLGKSWLHELTISLPKEERVVANIVFLAAFSPHMITEEDILAVNMDGEQDTYIVELCFWAIQTLGFRIETWLAAPFLAAQSST